MQTKHTVFERDETGQLRPVDEVLDALECPHEAWELRTQDRAIPGTLEGHPLSAHVFTDTAGREYRVT